ncbi:MAG: Ldh family oxidoreductase [Caldilineaceae bacterium]
MSTATTGWGWWQAAGPCGWPCKKHANRGSAWWPCTTPNHFGCGPLPGHGPGRRPDRRRPHRHARAEGNQYGVVPTFGARAMFSTNPIAIGFPAHEEPDFLLDMATSTTPMNRVVMRQELGQAIPDGWALDAEGRPTTDPATAKMLLPLGGTREHGSHKGYGLAIMVETLCGLLSGGWTALTEPLANGVDHAQSRDAHFFAAVRVDLFRPLDEFTRGMDAMIRSLRATPRQPDQDRVYVAGEIEHETERKRLREGIPLPANVVADLWEMSRRFDVALSLEKR